MKLLLIEDEQELANSIQSYLTGNSFVCEWANNAKTAIDKISIYDYDCILLDLMLPDGNGFEILKELKRQNKTEGVIIISAKETLETRIEGFNLGADDYLTKPFHLSELLVRIQALIRRKNFKGNNLVAFNEIEIEGNWLWFWGNTFEYRDFFKTIGARWSSTHKRYYYFNKIQETTISRAYAKDYDNLKQIYKSTRIKKNTVKQNELSN